MALENDVVLIYLEQEPMAFARVEHITADSKPEWFQVTLLILAVPLKTVTWILREEYINGAEFTMDGKAMRLEKVVSPAASRRPESPPADPDKARHDNGKSETNGQTDNVIRFPDAPRRDHPPE